MFFSCWCLHMWYFVMSWTRWKFWSFLLLYAYCTTCGIIRQKAQYPVQSSTLLKWADLDSSIGSCADKYFLVTSQGQKLGGTIIDLHSSHVISPFSQMLEWNCWADSYGKWLSTVYLFSSMLWGSKKIQFSKCSFTDCSMALCVLLQHVGCVFFPQIRIRSTWFLMIRAKW